ncbi:Nramp family divalent metal transporter [Planctomycetota bacterium]
MQRTSAANGLRFADDPRFRLQTLPPSIHLNDEGESMTAHDPYALDASRIKEPPTGVFQSLKYIGPGFILSASIVGSGELIATTIVGARAGFILLWFIIFSCIVKVAVQLEFGKHAISSGESTMKSLNSLPGPRLGLANWSIWIWLVLMLGKMMQVGGIVGGVVLAVEQFVPPAVVAFDVANFDQTQPIVLGVNEIGDTPITLSENWTTEDLVNRLGETWTQNENGTTIETTDHAVKELAVLSGDSTKISTIASKLPLSRILLAFGVAASVSILVFQGYYILIEKASLVMIGAFTVFTLASLLALQSTEMAIRPSEIASGLVPLIPGDRALIFVAIGAFGITGVGGDEIMAYNYWLIEKGYASYAGPKDDSPDWERRAKGWIRIMYWDALLSMVAYTGMTVMFYLLGAAVLNRQGLVPAGGDLIDTLGEMYTQTLQQPWARSMFVVGAIVVLYSTLFAALAAWTRLFADAFGRVGMYRFENRASRRIAIGILAWIIPAIWATLFLYMGKPAMMVIVGGTATVVILLIVVFAALWFRYRRLDKRLLPTKVYDVCLWTSAIAIATVAILSTEGVYKGILDVLSK